MRKLGAYFVVFALPFLCKVDISPSLSPSLFCPDESVPLALDSHDLNFQEKIKMM